MALADVTIKDKANVDVVFSFQSMIGTSKVLYSDGSRALTTPRILTTGHQKTGSGSNARDRHLFRLDITKLAADGVTPVTMPVYQVMDVPRQVFAIADVLDAIAILKNALTDANVTKLVANQYL